MGLKMNTSDEVSDVNRSNNLRRPVTEIRKEIRARFRGLAFVARLAGLYGFYTLVEEILVEMRALKELLDQSGD